MEAETTKKLVGEALSKSSRPVGKPVKRYQWDVAGTGSDFKKRPDNAISPEILRRFSVTHEVSRICINARKRQLAQLGWDIVPLKSAKKKQQQELVGQADLVKQYFKHLAGYRSRFRQLQDVMVEDLLVLDQICLYKEVDARGRLLWVKPVDAATIKVVVNEYGDTPEPPDIAYRQYIRGKLTAEFTADQLIFDLMNPRTTTPYGLAPLESLILVVSAALRSTLFNLDYLSFENMPEGLLEMPEGWGATMISEFQGAWDALLSGNGQENSKLRVVPSGTKYAATKKPDEMAFKEFNDWLMQITCAMFDVQPHEIGFTDNTNRATAHEQTGVMTRKALLPLCQMMKEIWDDIIQLDLGFADLEFIYLGIEDRDNLEDAQTDSTQVKSGLKTVDEIRVERGLDPIGIDTPFVVAGKELIWLSSGVDNTPLDDQADTSEVAPIARDDEPQQNAGEDKKGGTANTSIAGDYNPATDQTNDSNSVNTAAQPTFTKAVSVEEELRKFQLFATKRFKERKSYRDFQSDIIDESIVAELNAWAEKATSVDEIKKSIHAIGHLLKASRGDKQTADRNKILKALYGVSGYQALKDSFKKGIADQLTVVAQKLESHNELPSDIDKFVADNLPKLDVSAAEVADWFKTVTNKSVNLLYKEIGANTKFNLTANAYTKQLEADAADLLTKSTLDGTTRKTVANIIVKGKQTDKTPAEIAKDITDRVPHISDMRSNMIAQAETANIASRAQYEAFLRMGVKTKAWICYGSDPCPVCLANAGDGAIPMGAMFSSGDLMPIAHPFCECGLDEETVDPGLLSNAWDGSDFED